MTRRAEMKASAICALVMIHEEGELTAQDLIENIEIIIGNQQGRTVLTSLHDVTREFLREYIDPRSSQEYGWGV